MLRKLTVIAVLASTAAVPASAEAGPSQRSKDVKSCQQERRGLGKASFRTKYRTLAGCLRARAAARGAKEVTPATPPVVPVDETPGAGAVTVIEEVTTTTTTTVSDAPAAAFPELPGNGQGKGHGKAAERL